jgi:hypothetical protein
MLVRARGASRPRAGSAWITLPHPRGSVKLQFDRRVADAKLLAMTVPADRSRSAGPVQGTLGRRYVAALGGTLMLIADFGD